MKRATTTPAQFRRRAVAAFHSANPDAATATIEWVHCARVTWADGTPGFSGIFAVDAPGYRPRRMLASLTTAALVVR